LAQAIRSRAAKLGFHAVGFARADVALDEDFERYQAFVAAGMHGDMAYLARDEQARRGLDGQAILPGARTVVCVARRYDRGDDEARDPALAQRIARYARGRDYHGFVKKRVARLAAFVRSLAEGTVARALCDTAPVLERAWAARSGLGFVGKNGLVIVPGQGSYCLLGEVVTTLALAAADYGRAIGERCGSCRACLDACPTGAFPRPFVLDPRRCVSYWTIESRSLPPAELHDAVGAELFGCDRCQEACPYNRVPPPPAVELEPFRPHPRWGGDIADLVWLDDEGFAALTSASPVRRATRRGLSRNALLMAARRARAGDREADALVRDARRHPEPSLRELAEALSAPAEPNDA
jgi:epoxyqueuosine reductase